MLMAVMIMVGALVTHNKIIRFMEKTEYTCYQLKMIQNKLNMVIFLNIFENKLKNLFNSVLASSVSFVQSEYEFEMSSQSEHEVLNKQPIRT